MMSRIMSPGRSALLLYGVAALLAVAHADITTEERVTVSGPGGMKMLNMSGTTVTTIAGDRARTDSNLQFESGMLRAFARGAGQTSEIVRLDQDKIYELHPPKKTYSEATFAERRAQLQQSMQKMQESQDSQQQAATGVDESKCEWSDPKAEVIRSGEKATIAGYQAERVVINASQTCTDKESGQACDFGLTLDQWLAPGFEDAQETLAYQKAYAEKLGLTATASRDFAERAQTMFGRYKGIWSEVAAKTRDLKGHPVKASFGLGMGGPQCQNAKQAGASGDSPSSVGGAIGNALGGLLGKKKKEQQPASTTPPAATPNGLVPLMTVSTELVSVNRNAVDPQTFEVPAEYKKVTD